MANVLHRTTLEYRRSVHTPDFDPKVWLINPDLSVVKDVPREYWIVDGEKVREMTALEKVTVDAAELLAYKAAKLNTLRETATEKAAEATADYKAAKVKVDAARTKAEVDEVTLEMKRM